ncbi:hypothetical protein BDF19DRAFT_466703 [Syncephalis fuscata]|nr:hypothetical protein BDF19DRAFT_466703 [Syncephalis fuscata]
MKISITIIICVLAIALIANVAMVNAKPTRLRRSIKMRRSPQNQNMDSAGNIVASIMSNSGNGSINQGSDNNGAANNFVNSVVAGPTGQGSVQTVASNQQTSFINNHSFVNVGVGANA